MASEMTIMGDVHIGHQEVLGTDGGLPTALYRRAVDCDILAKDIVMADDDLGRFPLISEVLRRSADRGKGMQLIPLTNLRPSVDRHMR